MATNLEELGNYVQDILDEVCAIEFSLPHEFLHSLPPAHYCYQYF